MIDLVNLSKKYGSHEVLKDISFHFETGKVYGIMGENGAGKTTLFRCIAGLESYGGAINSSLQPLKDSLGWLPTDLFFFSKMTGREYLQLLCNARSVKLQDVDTQNIFELPLDEYATTYSTGMKKKLALMAILLQHNEVFILDEPYNGVDIQSNILIMELLLKLKQMGKTLLISSHIFSTLAEVCDQILVLKEGRIVRVVEQDAFQSLEEEMKSSVIASRLDKWQW